MPCRARPGRESVLVVSCPLAASLLSHPNSMRGNAGHTNLWLRYRSRRVWGRVRVAVREAQDERHDVMDAPAWRIVVRLVAGRGRRGYWCLIRSPIPSSIRSIMYGRTDWTRRKAMSPSSRSGRCVHREALGSRDEDRNLPLDPVSVRSRNRSSETAKRHAKVNRGPPDRRLRMAGRLRSSHRHQTYAQLRRHWGTLALVMIALR
jgi:hypothetical protein